MKQLYFLFTFVFLFSFSQAQIIDIPDASFKNLLVNTICADLNNDGYYETDVDTNDDGEIQLSEAQAVQRLKFENVSNYFSSEGLVSFNNLKYFDCIGSTSTYNGFSTPPDFSQNLLLEGLTLNYMNMESLDISNNTNLQSLGVSFSNLDAVDVSQNVLLENLSLYWLELSALDLTQNINLTNLTVSYTDLTDIDLSNNIYLTELRLQTNFITALDLSENTLLELIYVPNNNISSLNISNNINLITLNCDYNDFEILDLSNNINLELAYFRYNDNFKYFIFKIDEDNYNSYLHFGSNPNLQYICTDESLVDYFSTWVTNQGYDCTVNSYCSFVPSGEYYTVQGQTSLDINLNGCEDVNDLPIPNLKFNITDGITDGEMISNLSGYYFLPLEEGNYTITPTLEKFEYFEFTPEEISISFPPELSPVTQNFCLTSAGDFNDLEVVIIPLEEARPGFDTDYKIVYKNKGTTTHSGTVFFDFTENSGLMEFVSSNPVNDTLENDMLTWSYTNLQPFETREILVTLNMNAPTDTPPLNGGEDIGYVADIHPYLEDETPGDNNFQIKLTVVNSYDPNDITCLEGETITPEKVGEYVHYLVRFENTGTASAINIVVKDEIDLSKFDISTLIPLSGSHDYYTRVRDNNIVEFIFEDINLPFEDASNDGYVLFKIKTLETLQLGDVFTSEANIYFDYNFPILTNTANTEVAEALSVSDFENNHIKVYPNPTKDLLTITTDSLLSRINITDINGRVVMNQKVSSNSNLELDLSSLNKGMYFVNVQTDTGSETVKVVKQ